MVPGRSLSRQCLRLEITSGSSPTWGRPVVMFTCLPMLYFLSDSQEKVYGNVITMLFSRIVHTVNFLSVGYENLSTEYTFCIDW